MDGNIVYLLIKRVKQLDNGEKPLVVTPLFPKLTNTEIALQEIREGKVRLVDHIK